MPFKYILLALSVVAIWGINFVVIQVALKEIPPLMLTFLRFFFAAFPAVFFFQTSSKYLMENAFLLLFNHVCT